MANPSLRRPTFEFVLVSPPFCTGTSRHRIRGPRRRPRACGSVPTRPCQNTSRPLVETNFLAKRAAVLRVVLVGHLSRSAPLTARKKSRAADSRPKTGFCWDHFARTDRCRALLYERRLPNRRGSGRGDAPRVRNTIRTNPDHAGGPSLQFLMVCHAESAAAQLSIRSNQRTHRFAKRCRNGFTIKSAVT